MKVLIVDDNTGTREMMRIVVSKLGHEVVGEAADGNSALKAFAELRPDVVLLDIIMPGKSGVEVMDEILKTSPAAKVVIVTAVNQDELNNYVSSRAYAIVYKPFSFEEFAVLFRKLGGSPEPA